MQAIKLTDEVGKLAATMPAATTVFMVNGIDFCCIGKSQLKNACNNHNLDASQVLAEIETLRQAENQLKRPDGSLSATIAFSVENLHRPLGPKLRTIQLLLERTQTRHGNIFVDTSTERAALFFSSLGDELQDHFKKEEEVLFPMILTRHGHRTKVPIRIVRREHSRLEERLTDLAAFTTNYKAPASACHGVLALYRLLKDFASLLHRHIQYENTVLFPRAQRD